MNHLGRVNVLTNLQPLPVVVKVGCLVDIIDLHRDILRGLQLTIRGDHRDLVHRLARLVVRGLPEANHPSEFVDLHQLLIRTG